jgi:AraC-like DNA-binding protein
MMILVMAKKGDGPVSTTLRERLEQALRFIQANCTKGILLEDVAAVTGFSSFHFHRLFRTCFGKTVKEAITECQIELAKQLLLQGVAAAEVATRVGFCNQSHLTYRFRRITGLPPIAWLQRARSEPAKSPRSAAA